MSLLKLFAAALSALGMGVAWAQSAPLALRISPLLQEKPTEAELRHGPVQVEGQRIQAMPDLATHIEGEASLRRPGLSIRAEVMDYDQVQDKVTAQGQVRIHRDGTLLQGPYLQLQMDSFLGKFEEPQFELYKNGGYGSANRVDFVGPGQMLVRQANYSTCRPVPGADWLPDWLLKAGQMTVDEDEDTIAARDVQLRFKDVPVLGLPGISFSLSGGRQSGLLPPLVGVDTVNGIEVVQPYYWNIAPNRDATFTTQVMSKRGVAVDTDFRYLERDYNGQARLNLMPSDKLREDRRWGWSSQHNGAIDTGIKELGSLGFGLRLARVSDDNYWRDFPRLMGEMVPGAGGAQRTLPSTGTLSWGRGHWSANLLVQKWQTLQDVVNSSYITPPYNQVPAISARYSLWDADGLDTAVTLNTTRFEADYSRLTSGAVPLNGNRSYIQAQVSRPFVRPWGYITPSVKLHATRYALDQSYNGATSYDRALPTLSLDSGLTFERNAQWFGRSLVQTLEPRAYFSATPYLNQSAMPVYDSGITDFNLATIFSDSPYVGQDRIVDNRSLTLGVISRFLDEQSGAEMLRLGMAQRYRFVEQQVQLPGDTAATGTGLSDVLFGGSLRWDERVSSDLTTQVDAQTNRFNRTTLQTRYKAGPYRVLNAAYRMNRQTTTASEQVDLGWQWPLSALRWGSRPDDAGVSQGGLGAGRWYSVGRLNFSLSDRKLVDSIVGLEYDGGCWTGRMVFERLQSTVASATTRLMFQLEFVGLAKVGTSSFKSLRDNISGYQELRDNTEQPSRFVNYE
ncbi:MAG: LPS-assembly protein LptD precursor [Pseudomonadota bacterium]